MRYVTTYSQKDFDLLIKCGMPDTQKPCCIWSFEDGETEAVIEFCVPIEIAEAYDKAFKPHRNMIEDATKAFGEFLCLCPMVVVD